MEDNNIKPKEIIIKKKKKSIDIKALMNMDIKTIQSKLSNSLKKINKVKTPEKKRKVIAFDMGSSVIKIIQGMYYKNVLTVDKYVSIKIPKDTIIDGQIKKSQELINLLDKTLKENGFNGKYGTCTNNSSLIINREISIPKVDDDEIDTVVRYEIQQYLPINLEDYVLQVQILNEVQINETARLNVRVIAYPNKIARGYYDMLLKLNLKPYALDVNYNSVNKFINYTQRNNEDENNQKDTVAYIDMGATFIDVNIYKDGKLDFTRIIKAGGNDIDGMLAERVNKELQTIEQFKGNNVDLHEYFEPVNIYTREIIDDWVEKIEKIIQFYKNKNQGNDVNKIIIFGGSSKLNGLIDYMQTKLGIEISKEKELSNLLFKSNDNGRPIEDFINVIGSLIRI